MQNLSYENEFYLHVNENLFSYERLCTETRFEKEVQNLVQNLSYENEFYLHVNENLFSYERLCTETRFEKEVQDKSEMAYSGQLNHTVLASRVVIYGKSRLTAA